MSIHAIETLLNWKRFVLSCNHMHIMYYMYIIHASDDIAINFGMIILLILSLLLCVLYDMLLYVKLYHDVLYCIMFKYIYVGVFMCVYVCYELSIDFIV